MSRLRSCPSCGKEVRGGARFCGACGASLAAGCPACGASVEDCSARFCEQCGSPLAAPAAPRSPEPISSVTSPPLSSPRSGGDANIPDSFGAGNGLGIYDVSEIAERKPNPHVAPVGKVTWTDGAIGQHALPMISRGRSYVVFVDEFHHGGARIIDVADERNPRLVSKLKLEIQMPEHRELAYRVRFTNGVWPFR